MLILQYVSTCSRRKACRKKKGQDFEAKKGVCGS